MFKINDKVVCVDDSGAHHTSVHRPHDWVKRDAVYCIREVRDDELGDPGVTLVGVVCGYWFSGKEATWNPARFRLVSEVQAENRLKRTQKKPA